MLEGRGSDWRVKAEYSLPVEMQSIGSFGIQDINHDGKNDLEVSGYTGEGHVTGFLAHSFASGSGTYGDWTFVYDPGHPLLDNLPRRLIEHGDARAFVGAVAPTYSTAQSATLAETHFTRYYERWKNCWRIHI